MANFVLATTSTFYFPPIMKDGQSSMNEWSLTDPAERFSLSPHNHIMMTFSQPCKGFEGSHFRVKDKPKI